MRWKVSEIMPFRCLIKINIPELFCNTIQLKLKSPINSNTSHKSSWTKIPIFDSSFDDRIRYIRFVFDSCNAKLYYTMFYIFFFTYVHWMFIVVLSFTYKLYFIVWLDTILKLNLQPTQNNNLVEPKLLILPVTFLFLSIVLLHMYKIKT